MAEHPIEGTQVHRLPYLDPSNLEDRTRPPDPVPMWLGRPYERTDAGGTQRLRRRARDLLRLLTRPTTRT